MQKINLQSLTEGVYLWIELESRIASLPSEQERGEAFEEFCKAFFVLDPIFQFEKVYRQNEIPQSLKQKLGYPGVQDIGIDGLAVTIEGKLYAYQAKFRSDRNDIPTLRELSTFFTVSDRADWRITITNANSLPSSINDRLNQSRILADRFDLLDSNFFDRLRLYLKEQRIEPQKKKTPHQTQEEAIEAALSFFKENNRGQLILPCGIGKTLVAMWIAEKLGGSRLLVMVPSLSLMSQTLSEWAANTFLKPFRYLCLCSDTTVDLGKDSPIEHLYEMDVPVTTDAEVVSDFLKQEPSITSILFSTYQSSKVLSESVKKTGISFDTAIFDEAHRTTGSDVGVWNLALNDKNVPIKKRIFMTATPRIYAPHISKKAKEKDILLYSMDDNEVYGKPFFEMTFGQAIEKNLITDYKVVIICVTDREVKELIQSGGRIITDDNHEWDAKAFAKQVALVKAIEAYKLKKIFTFHSRVPSAKAFTQPDSTYGIKQAFEIAGTSQKKLSPFHVNGTMSSGLRNSIMKDFKESEIGIMSSARCLIEGIDVPAVDTVAFIDPKKSIIDIVQATGRALRKAEWKEKGYIFIPVVVDEDANPEVLIKSSDFDTVWEVLQAMMDQDQRLESIVSQLRTMQGEGKEDAEAWQNTMSEYAEKVEFYNLPKKIEYKRFVEKLHTKIIEMTAKTWDFWYGLTLKYKEEFRNANALNRYKTPEGYTLGLWQSHQKTLYRIGQLSSYRIKKLQEIGFVFPLIDEYYETIEEFTRGFNETLRYDKQFGTVNADMYYKTLEEYPLGKWQEKIRKSYREGKLPIERIQRLEFIGFDWTQHKDQYDDFEKGFDETFMYQDRFGDSNAPQNYTLDDGYPLGIWQSKQRQLHEKGDLDAEKIKRLESLGFKWRLASSPAEAFVKGLLETMKYKEEFGNPNALVSYKTRDGYPLGEWQSHQRKAFNRGKLDKERIRMLEDVGFKFKRGERDDQKISETLKSREILSKLTTIKDKVFGSGLYEALRYKDFEKGFQITLINKEQIGNANVPLKYKTPDGYKLGEWQAEQRLLYHKGKLSLYKIRMLEEVGFIWTGLNRKPHK